MIQYSIYCVRKLWRNNFDLYDYTPNKKNTHIYQTTGEEKILCSLKKISSLFLQIFPSFFFIFLLIFIYLYILLCIFEFYSAQYFINKHLLFEYSSTGYDFCSDLAIFGFPHCFWLSALHSFDIHFKYLTSFLLNLFLVSLYPFFILERYSYRN